MYVIDRWRQGVIGGTRGVSTVVHISCWRLQIVFRAYKLQMSVALMQVFTDVVSIIKMRQLGTSNTNSLS